MAIFNQDFYVYERLASDKMDALVSALNAHTHAGGDAGQQLYFYNILGDIDATQIANNTITGDMIVDGTITAADIANYTITYNKLDDIDNGLTSTIKMRDGYAVYSP